MRKLAAFVGLLMWALGVTMARAAEPPAFTKTVQSDTNGLTLTLQVDLSQLKYNPANGGALTLPGCETIPCLGGWAVPTTELQVILPSHVLVTALEVTPTTDAVSGVELALQQTPRSPNDCPTPDPLPPAPALFPNTWAALGTASYHHGVHVQTIRVSPVQLDFLANQVVGARQMVIRLAWQAKTTPDSFIKPQATHPEAKRVRQALKATAVNGANLEALTDIQALRALALNGTASATYVPKSPTGTVDGVILCPEALVSAYQPLADDKTRAGHPWDVVTYEWIHAQPAYQQGRFTDAPARIRAFLQEAYTQYNLQFVLFGGEEGPPYLPAGVKNAGQMLLHRNFGYYTNLDGGDHTDLHTLVEHVTTSVLIGHPDVNPPAYVWRYVSTTLLVAEEVTSHPTRCGYIPFGIAGGRQTMWDLRERPVVSDVSPNPLFDPIRLGLITKEDWIRAHPEFIFQTVVYETYTQRLNLSTCDLTPELLAGYLPPPAALGATVGLGLYQTKLRRFQEPRHPNEIVNKNWSLSGIRCPIVGDLFASFVHVVAHYGGVIPSDYVQSDTIQDGFLRVVPEGYGLVGGVHPLGGCTTHGAANGWRSDYSVVVDHPELGALAAVYDGYPIKGFHTIFGNRISRMLHEIEGQYGWPFSRLGLYLGWEGWATGHMSVFYGDPSLKPWAGAPERLIVTHPHTLGLNALDTFDVTVKDAQNQPLPGAGVALSKRRPDGTYALYQRETTDANGVATFEIGDVYAFGAGVFAVEIDAFPQIPFRAFYPYHGRVSLSANTPPTVVTNLPTEILQTTPQGSWVILDAGASFDADGDPVELTWTWTDNRTGTPVVHTETGRYQRVFLPSGANPVTVTASDGQATATQPLTVTVKDLTPPVVQASPVTLTHWHTWVTVPIRVNTPVSGGLIFTASDAFSGIGPWVVMSVTANESRTPAPVTFSLFSSNDLLVYAEENPDGSARTYTVTVQVHDTAGNAATADGVIIVAPMRPPMLSLFWPVAVTQRADWVTVPIYLNNDPSEYHGGGVNFTVFDPRGLAGWQVTGVQATDPRQPASVTFTLQGNTSVRVLTEGNDDLTLRRYLVTVAAWNTFGLTATATGEIGVIPPALIARNPYRFQGQVGQGQLDEAGNFVVPPIIVTPEPGTIVQFVGPDGSETVRAQVEADGTWTAWLPYSEFWNVQATRGGRSLLGGFTYRYTFEALTPPGVRMYNARLPLIGRFVSRARPSGNQPPFARVAPIGTTSVTPVILDGRASSDPDGDLLTYSWTWTQNRTAYRRSGPVVSAPLLLGNTTITLTVSDGTASATKVFTVSVVKPSTLGQAAE